jgi:hypothetical protein
MASFSTKLGKAIGAVLPLGRIAAWRRSRLNVSSGLCPFPLLRRHLLACFLPLAPLIAGYSTPHRSVSPASARRILFWSASCWSGSNEVRFFQSRRSNLRSMCH